MPNAERREAREQVSAQLDRINEAWLQGRPEELVGMFHDAIVMVFPGFSDRVRGVDAVTAGFVDFSENARIHFFEESDRQIDIVGDVAVVSLAYELGYEREGQGYRSTGRDCWIFGRYGDRWLAVWRTMLDVNEEPIDTP